MIGVNDLKKGIVIEYDGKLITGNQLYEILQNSPS